jgi:hypothetical protein
MLSGGGIVHGRVENVYDDGIAIRDGDRVFYIPVTGLVSVIYNGICSTRFEHRLAL